MSGDWPLWEVFVRTKGGLAHRHVGSVHAPDQELALRHARDAYTRRMEGVSLWVVPSAAIVASDPAEAGELFEPAADNCVEIPLANRGQIMIPRGATVLENRHGTAPGLWLEDDRHRWCAMLPGVPREMRGMLAGMASGLLKA